MDKKENTGFIVTVATAVILIAAAAAFIMFKLGQQSVQREKWKDYDDYGWS